MKWLWRAIGFVSGTMYLTGIQIIFMEDETLIAALTWLFVQLNLM